MSEKDTFVLIDDDAVETKTTDAPEKKYVSNKFTILSFGILAAVLHTYYGGDSNVDAVATAPVVSEVAASTYVTDITCMGALSLARDITEHTDRDAFMKFTDVQNQYYLKYEGGISDDVATAKAAVLVAWKMDNSILLITVAQCVADISK